jgi:hypothetical protein
MPEPRCTLGAPGGGTVSVDRATSPTPTPAGKARLLDVEGRNPARHGLSAGGNRIRTIGPALCERGISAVAGRTDNLDAGH